MLCAQDSNHGRAAPGKQANQPVQKSLSPKLQQRLRRAHAPRLTAGQDQSAGHLSNSARQSELALRRTAIISATTDTAISSGETAPISSPMGANTRVKLSRAMPSFSSSLITLIMTALSENLTKRPLLRNFLHPLNCEEPTLVTAIRLAMDERHRSGWFERDAEGAGLRLNRSEERRVRKEGRSRWSPY